MKSESKFSRRSFLRKTAIGGGAAAAGTALAAPAVLAQAPMVLKMQTSWGANNVWQEFAQDYADRVEAMSGGRLKIDVLPAGAVVAAFQVMDAVNDGVIDAAHSVSAYWYGKSKSASLFGTGPVFGASSQTMLGWFYEGGGEELYRELTQDELGLDVVGLLGFPMFAQPFGWFKGEVNSVADIQGFKYRTVGLAADLLQTMGMSVAQLPGGEIVPAMERGVIDAFEFNNPSSDRDFGAQDVAKNYYLSSYHQASEQLRVPVQPLHLRGSGARSAGDPALRGRGLGHGEHVEGDAALFRRPAMAPGRGRRDRAADVAGHPAGPDRGLVGDPVLAGRGCDVQEDRRQPARLGREGRLLRTHERARLRARLRALLPGQALALSERTTMRRGPGPDVRGPFATGGMT